MTITQEVDLDPGEVYQEMHDSKHLALVVDGLADSIQQDIDGVTGVESLTTAQHYLEGALRADGSVGYSSVTGNESFFSAIGDAGRKAWEYIQKMFKAIWAFFFGKDKKAETQVDDTTKAIDEADKQLSSASLTGKGDSPATVQKEIKATASAIARDPSTPAEEKKVAEELVEELSATPPPSPAQTKVIAGKVAKINKKQIKKLDYGFGLVKGKVTELSTQITKLYQDADKLKEDGGEAYTAYRAIIDAIFEDNLPDLVKATNTMEDALLIQEVSEGARALEILKRQMVRIKQINGFINACRPNIQHRIEQCEKLMNVTADIPDRKEKARKELLITKEMMIALNSIASFVQQSCLSIQSLCDSVVRMFGIKP